MHPLNIPDGRYDAVAEGPAKIDRTSKGTWFVELCFRIASGEHEGKPVYWRGFFSEKTRERTRDSLRLCGFVGSDIREIARQRLSNPVSITVETEAYKGKSYTRVQWINEPGQNNSGDGDINKLSEELKSLFADGSQQSAPMPTYYPRDEDLPF